MRCSNLRLMLCLLLIVFGCVKFTFHHTKKNKEERKMFSTILVLLAAVSLTLCTYQGVDAHFVLPATSPAAPGLRCLQTALGESSPLLALPNSKAYLDTIDIHNTRLVFHPIAVALPRNESDLVSILNAAKNCSAPFTIVSGGHSAAGYCISQHGLTVNMRSMNMTPSFGTLSDGKTDTMIVPAGARFGSLYGALLNYKNGSRVIVGGGCHGVAPGGYFLGGGWSFLSRLYGLAADNVLRVRMVLPNRTVATVTKKSDPDLFWALSGGGGGNFGTVINYEVKLHVPPEQNTVGVMCWPQENDTTIRSMFSDWIKNFSRLPKWINIDPVWLPYGPTGSRHFCWQVFCINSPTQCQPYVEGLRSYQPSIDNVKIQPFLNWQANLGNKTSDAGGALYVKSFFFSPENFTVETVDLLIASLAVSPSPHNLVLFHVGGGAVAEVPPNATAFPWRNCNLLMQIKAIWKRPQDASKNIAWADQIAAAVAHNVSGAYVNYIDASLSNWKQAYYGDNYAKLLEVKRRVDPSNLYHFNQSVGADNY